MEKVKRLCIGFVIGAFLSTYSNAMMCFCSKGLYEKMREATQCWSQYESHTKKPQKVADTNKKNNTSNKNEKKSNEDNNQVL